MRWFKLQARHVTVMICYVMVQTVTENVTVMAWYEMAQTFTRTSDYYELVGDGSLPGHVTGMRW
jgi:hypothetical protein